jgi:hypothetical protein
LTDAFHSELRRSDQGKTGKLEATMPIGPYDPPKARVADVNAEVSRPRPPEVRRAAMMLWGSLGLGILNILLEPSLNDSTEAGWTGWIVFGGVFATIALLTAFIFYGHNWARIVFLVLFIVGCIPFMLLLPHVVAQSAIIGTINIVQQVLQFGALFLVFTKPGALWFRESA